MRRIPRQQQKLLQSHKQPTKLIAPYLSAIMSYLSALLKNRRPSAASMNALPSPAYVFSHLLQLI